MIKQVELLRAHHNLSCFDCGSPEQNDFLHTKSLHYVQERNANTFVIALDDHVIAFYSLCMASISKELAREQEPQRIPCILLAQLGVDKEHQKQGYSKRLMLDCFGRAIATSTDGPACRYLLVDIKEEKLAPFYENFGFRKVAKTDKRSRMITMLIGLSDIQETLAIIADEESDEALAAKIKLGDRVKCRVTNGKIIISKERSKTLVLDDFLALMTEKVRHDEASWGADVGREVIDE